MVPAVNGPINKGIFTNICSLFPSPNFPIMIVPTQVTWFQKSISYHFPLRHSWCYFDFFRLLSVYSLCERPKRNSFIRTNSLKSIQVAVIFVSILSCGTKSKAFEKSMIIASVLTSSSSESAISWQNVTTWLSREYTGLKPCWPSYNHPLISQTCLRYHAITCSIYLQTNEAKLPGQ